MQSKLKNQIYVGSTKDLKKRFEEHNQGQGKSTKRYLPWNLIYYEAFSIEQLARDREMKLKHNGNAMKELKKRIGLGFPSTSSGKHKTGAGFSLLELLIVIAVIGVLMSGLIALINPVAQMQKARDSKVKTIVSQIQTALELYRADCGNYPSAPLGTSISGNCAGSTIVYLQTIPAFPSPAMNNFRYTNPGGSLQRYEIRVCLEKDDPALGTDPACTPRDVYVAANP